MWNLTETNRFNAQDKWTWSRHAKVYNLLIDWFAKTETDQLLLGGEFKITVWGQIVCAWTGRKVSKIMRTAIGVLM